MEPMQVIRGRSKQGRSQGSMGCKVEDPYSLHVTPPPPPPLPPRGGGATPQVLGRQLPPPPLPLLPLGGLRPTVSCQRCRTHESMGAKGARRSMGTKGTRRKFCPLCTTLSLNPTLTLTPTPTLSLVLTPHVPLPYPYT